MKWKIGSAAMAIMMLMSSNAWAEGDREYCPERPGLGTTPCTIDAGHVSVEASLIDWTGDNQADQRTDTFVNGSTVVRLGVTDHLEIRGGWTPMISQRTRDKSSGDIAWAHGPSDLTLGIKENLKNPGGDGFSIALLPQATIPVSGSPLGQGDWGVDLLIPMSLEVNDRVSLGLTPEVDAEVNGSRKGRHLAYSIAGGVDYALTKSIDLTIESSSRRDLDPQAHRTYRLAAVSLAWKPTPRLQLDVSCVHGINRASPQLELYLGVSRRF